MIIVTPMDSVFVLILVTFCSQIHGFYIDENGGDTDIALDKRRISRAWAFPCNGYDHLPRCLHGGKGPSKRRTKAGRFCVCVCNSKWAGPECSFASEDGRTLRGKRMDYYGPWSILGMGSKEGKRADTFEIDNGEFQEDSNHIPYSYLGYVGNHETRVPGFVSHNRKRSMPWVILNKSPPSGWYRNYDTDSVIGEK